MKHGPILMILAFSGVAIGYAQDEAGVAPPGSNQLDGRLATAANEASQTSQLEKLDWMVGQWVDRGENSTITTECSWTKNGKFLSRSFNVSVGDQVTLEGTQMVGWDPIKQCIRSWTFDSEGGFGEGRWIQDGNRWLVKTSFVLANGDRASAINVITHAGPGPRAGALWTGRAAELAVGPTG